MSTLYNLARVTTATTSTGTITLGSAVSGYLTFALAGVPDGATVSYGIKDGANSEIGTGVYTASGTALTRNVTKSTNSNAAISLSGSAEVFITPRAEDIPTTLMGRNILANPAFTVDQRYLGVETAIADNVYWADRWRYIGEASANCKAKDTTFGAVKNGYIKFTGTTDKGGIFQVVEGINCKHLRSTSVVLAAMLSVSNIRLGNIKMGVAEFTGTEDAVSGDPVSAWGADGVTPTLAASWAFINTPANLSVTTSAVRYSVTATVGASANNIAVLIWNDDKSYTANDILNFSDIQLEAGPYATPIDRRPFADEQLLCNRYMRAIGGNTSARYGAARTYSAAGGELIMYLVIPMRASPSVTVNNPTNWNVNDASVAAAVSSVASSLTSPDTVNVNLNCAAVTANRPAFITPSNVNATMWFEAEI